MTPKPLRLLGTFLKKLLIAVFVLVAMVVTGELVARAAEPGPFSLLDENPYTKGVPGLPRIHKPDFEGRWDGTWYDTNSLGLRGPEVSPEKAPGEYRVVCIGDSCTFGKSVAADDTYPRQLEGLLEEELAEGRSATVINAGVNGFSGRQYIAMLKYVLETGLEPDLVVVGYNLNDFPNVLRQIDVQTTKATRDRKVAKKTFSLFGGPQMLDRMNEFALYRWARAVYRHLTRARVWEDAERFAKETGSEIKLASRKAQDDGVLDRLEQELRALRDMAHEAGADVAFFLFPYESQVYLEEYDRTPIEKLAGICGELDVPFVDLAEEFRSVAYETDPPREMYVFGDRYHPRPIGYRIVAEKVVDVIEDRGWLAGE